MCFIYIIQLEQGKYYVGKTNNPQFRLDCHFNLNGSAWTKKYKPIKVLELISNCDDYDEDKYTMKYMDLYGIHNVRGGSFVSIKFDKSTIDNLKRMSNGTNDKCFICSKKGHFAKDCKQEEYEEVWRCEYCNKEFNTLKEVTLHENVYCRNSQNRYSNPHARYVNYERPKNDGYEYNCCFRCGRVGHYSPSCYASTHIEGYYL